MNFVLDDIIDKFWKDGRVKELEEFAERNGFYFQRRERLDLQTYQIKDFRLFHGRKAKRLRGIISKQMGSVGVRIYDYVYYGESHKRKTTVFELNDPSFDLSPFIIRPKRSIQWVKEVFSRDTSFFPDLPGFHAYYEIDTFDQAELGEELTKEFVDLISSVNRVSVEGQGAYLLVYFRRKVISASRIIPTLDLALDLFENLKEALDDGDLV